jgi:hypothetical protein
LTEPDRRDSLSRHSDEGFAPDTSLKGIQHCKHIRFYDQVSQLYQYLQNEIAVLVLHTSTHFMHTTRLFYLKFDSDWGSQLASIKQVRDSIQPRCSKLRKKKRLDLRFGIPALRAKKDQVNFRASKMPFTIKRRRWLWLHPPIPLHLLYWGQLRCHPVCRPQGLNRRSAAWD